MLFPFFSDISESVIERSALAFVNGTPWDMHRPLENDCRLTFGTFHDADPYQINKAFWRSCSFLLGYACDTVFGENLALQLHSFPPPSGKHMGHQCIDNKNFTTEFLAPELASPYFCAFLLCSEQREFCI